MESTTLYLTQIPDLNIFSLLRASRIEEHSNSFSPLYVTITLRNAATFWKISYSEIMFVYSKTCKLTKEECSLFRISPIVSQLTL